MSTIMVVDDNPEITTLVKLTLELEGYDVIEVSSGDECLGLLYSGEIPDLILLDIMMPELDGWEVSRRIKANEKLKDIKILSREQLVETVKWLIETPPQ
jgi:CheY-like chemotaxis protein